MGKYNYEELATSSFSKLEEIMKQGLEVDVKDVIWYQFKGYNVNNITRLGGFQKFIKVFYEGKENGKKFIGGYNVKVVQNKLTDKWIKKGTDSLNPPTQGWYKVYSAKKDKVDNFYKNSLLINYKYGHNPLWDVSRTLRDYIVWAEKDNKNLLVGKAYVAIGPLRIPGGFFILERLEKLEKVAKR